LLVVTLVLTAVKAKAQDAPLPLDPLTARERLLADTIAQTDRRVRDFLRDGRTRLINVGFIAPKRAGETDSQGVPTRRHAEVMFYNYDRNQGMMVLVDLKARTVSDIAQIPGRSVPINSDEVAIAARLALADQRVVRLFGDRMPQFRVATRPATRANADSARIEGLRTLGATAADPCYRHRCIVLFFRVNNSYVEMNRVVVDVTAQQVLIRGSER
jgi:Cu2+-containing amine oxidase